ncbi:hypothetical protein BDV38DRAFT_275923 [Aspergillus pseudotamarii]|uniref:NTP binding protein n=1 Tax=Aspergillus pseudotamarii TaxID=132259 RepID=A0A5N6SBY3_ASPPS|nr:uncharacterized protein BDV38DRAFT_275923 [Aspergillus pseudotamarii]KAE8131467.1 hypothetical protein BDV38DRAFT_275923 [Aspergillus pseudotamarii]
MEGHIPLPKGHLLNLQPRARNGRRTKFSDQEAGNEQNGAHPPGTDQNSTESKIGSSKTPQTLLRRGRATKLPIPRAFADKGTEQRRETSVTPQTKQQNIKVHGQMKRSPGASDRESPNSTDKDREQYWRKVRGKFDREPPTASRSKDKQKDYYQEAYRKIISLASSPKHEMAKHKQKTASPTTRAQRGSEQGAKSRTKIAGPTIGNQDGPVSHSKEHSENQNGFQSSKDIPTSHETHDTTPQRSPDKTGNTTDSSIHSYPSISPVSGPSSSMTEWEDRFVVNMPSAKDPNPPTMSVEQIVEFQKSIENVHKEGEAMLDPDTLPSPRTTTPEDNPNLPDPERKQLSTLDGQDSRSSHSAEAGEQPATYQSGHNRYYSPDEIGKQRFSTIWEESPSRIKPKVSDANPDGSFLGCREIKGPYDKNPDEILFFSSTTERPRVVDVSTPMAKPKDWKKIMTPAQPTTAASEEKTVAQDERKPTFQSSKHVQCSKQSPKTMCHETICQRQDKAETPAHASGKENTNHAARAIRTQDQRKSHGDDVFIITPTITRTMVNTGETRGATPKRSGIPPRIAGETIKDVRAKPQMHPSPSGLRRATQNSWERSNATWPTPSFSRDTPVKNVPGTPQARAELGYMSAERRRAIRGYIRMPVMVKSRTENLGQRIHNNTPPKAPAAPPKNDYQIPARSISDSSQSTPSSGHDISPASSLTRDQRYPNAPTQTARIVEVAELDGLQVDDPRDEHKTDHKGNDKSGGKYTHEEHLRSKVADLRADLQTTGVQANYRGLLNSITMSLIMDVFFLSAAQAQGLFTQIIDNRHSKTVLFKIALNCILNMVEHCLHVFKNLLQACSIYTTTGVWPRPSEKDLARFLTDLCQVVIYLGVLGSIMMLLGRAVEYVILIGSWIVWFVRPLGWFLGALGRVLQGMTS